ncbi:MAG: hypothetical protein ACXVC4_00880 [Bdellovibrionota bacterium]
MGLLALSPIEARATRVANFNASGTSSLGANYGTTPNSSVVIAQSNLYSNCSVTITNNSSSTQNITYSITLSASLATNGGASGAYAGMPVTFSNPIVLAPAGTVGGTNCSSSTTCTIPQNSDSYVVGGVTLRNGDFPPLTSNGSTAYAESLSCYGSITVNDNSTTAPGFVTAAGALTTFTEASPGVSTSASTAGSNMATTIPSQTPIVISEGRPF